MSPISPVDFLRQQWSTCFEGDTWYTTVGHDRTLEEFLIGKGVKLPAVFFSYSGFVPVEDAIREDGRCSEYSSTITIYLMMRGDMYPVALRFRDFMNKPGNNQFLDLDDQWKRLVLRSGDGIRLQMEGIPAFELLFTIN